MMTWNSSFFHSPSSYVMEAVVMMHDYSMLFLSSVLMFVFLGMFNTVFLSSTYYYYYEDHQLETVWTFIPFIILLFMVYPSLETLYMLDTCIFCGMSILIMGHQWFWSYSYSEFPHSMDSYMLNDPSHSSRLLEVDNRLVVPSNSPIRYLVSSSDVIHSWTVPSMGVKMDAVPGRVNQFCFLSKRSGVYFGQCSEICGSNHSFMPIVLECVNVKNFSSAMLSQGSLFKVFAF